MNKFAALALAAALAGPAGCMIQQPNADIDRVHKPYLKKGPFQDGKSWYLRRTLIDAPPQSWFAIGDGDWPSAERIRWEVREDVLLGYRDYEIVPGTETAEQPGADYKGAPVLAFPITEHFDIRRGYNTLTGEQTNVIQKNTDRPWYEREYFTVNWGADLPSMLGPEWAGSLYASQFLPTSGTGYYVQEQEFTNPDRARFSDDYMEFTRRESYQTNLYSCWGGLNYAMVPDCAPGFVDRRWSFTRVKEDEDFEPTPFPDSVQLVDDAGNVQRDARGHARKVPIFEKFGFFRLERLTYDRDRGVTDSGRILRAFKFNLWKRSLDDAGAAIPYAQREPKPIIYYMNAEAPEDLWTETAPALNGLSIRQANRDIADAYDRVFREIVATLQGKALADVPRMFEVRVNDCNYDHVKQFAEDHESDVSDKLEPLGGLAEVTARHNELTDACNANPRGQSCSNLRQKWTYLLKQTCTALESATENRDDGEDKFTWQRLGDVRYSFMHLTDHLQSVGWLGLGMLAGDPITAEIKNAFAYVDGPGTDLSATIASDYVDSMNNALLVSDLVFGENISNFIEAKGQQVAAQLKGYPSAEQIANVDRRFRQLGGRPEDILKDGSGLVAERARIQGLAGSPLERVLVNEEDLLLAAGHPLDSTASASEDLLARASPARGGTMKIAEAYKERLKRASGGKDAPCRYLREFIDDALLGMAIQLKDLDPVARWAYLRYMIYQTVMMHEVGHTLGLRHNFMGTWDALNFTDTFHKKFNRYTVDPDGVQGPEERASMSLDDAYALAQGLSGEAQRALEADPPPADDERVRLQAEKAELDKDVRDLVNCAAKLSESEERYVTTCVEIDTSGRATATIENECRDNLPYARSMGQVITVDAISCLRVEEGKSSSVMDYHGKLNGRFGGLGKWDAAALKFGYGQIVEEFQPEALRAEHQSPANGELSTWLQKNDYKKISDGLVDGPEGLKKRVNRHVPWDANQTRFEPAPLEVPYGFCSDEYAYTGWLSGTDTCRIRDWGANHREQMQHDILRYKQYYFFTQFARNRLSWDIGAAIAGNQDVLDKILLTFQYMTLYRAHDSQFFASDLGKDFLQATAAGLDLYAEIVAQPEMGSFLESTGKYGFVRNSKERGRWLKTSTEDYLDLSADQLNQADNNGSGIGLPLYYYSYCELAYCIDVQTYPGLVCKTGQCEMPIMLGDGRPSFLNFTNDYEDWFFTYVGNYFDKSNVLYNLVDSLAYFPRLADETGAAAENPNIRLLRVGLPTVYGDNVRRLLHALITNRVKEYGSLWRPTSGFIPRPFGALDATAPQPQADDVVLMPRRFTNLPYRALLVGMALQSSLDDTALDFTSLAQVGVKGEEDDIKTWDTLPADQKMEFTHPITGVTYRAAKVGDYAIGYDLVKDTKRYADKYMDYVRCLDADPANDGAACSCTYVGAFRVFDYNEDGSIQNNPNECILLRPENGLNYCEERDEPCAHSDLVDMRERAAEDMEAAVERLENVRAFYSYFAFGQRL